MQERLLVSVEFPQTKRAGCTVDMLAHRVLYSVSMRAATGKGGMILEAPRAIMAKTLQHEVIPYRLCSRGFESRIAVHRWVTFATSRDQVHLGQIAKASIWDGC